jgi:hypothetical protein
MILLTSTADVSGSTLEYSREDGRFPVSASFVTLSNPDFTSSSETGVNHGIRS